MNVICVNCKEVYKIRPSRCLKCDGTTFEQTHAKTSDKGTITWFELNNYIPPPSQDEKSDWVLVWGKGGWAQPTKYVILAGTFIGQSDLPFTITHWAYINYPE